MEKLEFPRVGEQMYHQVLDNGLHIFVVPKPGFQTVSYTHLTLPTILRV